MVFESPIKFLSGGPGLTARKQPGRFFFSPQLIIQFTEGSNGSITEKTIQTFSRGESSFFRGGGGGGGGPNANFYRSPYNL